MEGGVEQQQEAGAAGVDHPGVAQDRQQVGRAGQRLASGVAGRPQHVGQVAAGVGRGARRLGGLAHDGEDRALDGRQHGLVGRGRRGLQAVGQRCRRSTSPAALSVDASPRRICDRITPLLPRAPISEPWLMASHVPARSSRRRLHLGDHRVERAGHVGAGVAVGHRVHVEPVDAPRGGARRRRGTW